MKVLVRLFLSLCYLLGCGYGSLYATAYKPTVPYATEQAENHTTHIHTEDNTRQHSFVQTPWSDTDDENEAIDAREEKEEEEKQFSLHKSWEMHTSLSALCSLLILDYFDLYLKKRLPFYTHFSFSSSHRYIVLRVLRL